MKKMSIKMLSLALGATMIGFTGQAMATENSNDQDDTLFTCIITALSTCAAGNSSDFATCIESAITACTSSGE